MKNKKCKKCFYCDENQKCIFGMENKIIQCIFKLVHRAVIQELERRCMVEDIGCLDMAYLSEQLTIQLLSANKGFNDIPEEFDGIVACLV